MTLLEIKADLDRVATAIERLTAAVERIAGPLDVKEPEPYVPKKTEPQHIGRVSMDPEAPAMKRLHELEKRLEIPR